VEGGLQRQFVRVLLLLVVSEICVGRDGVEGLERTLERRSKACGLIQHRSYPGSTGKQDEGNRLTCRTS
jgi:hypothetical protein